MNVLRAYLMLGICMLPSGGVLALEYNPTWFDCSTRSECSLVNGPLGCGFVAVNSRFADLYTRWDGERHATEGAACSPPGAEELRNVYADCLNGKCLVVEINEKKAILDRRSNRWIEKSHFKTK